MKTNRLVLVSLLGLASALAGHAAPAPGDVRAEVAFLEPENFSDVKDSDMSTDYRRTGVLEELREHIVTRSRYYVPAGFKLAVTFTDIDLAGEFEPWRGPQFSDIRIVKSIYPPRIDLSFRLLDAAGNVVKEGRRELRDLAFQMKLSINSTSDPLRYEKALLDDWMSADFPRVSKR